MGNKVTLPKKGSDPFNIPNKEKVMKNKCNYLMYLVLILTCISSAVDESSRSKQLRKKAAQKGFIEACLLLVDGHFSDAHIRARAIIKKYPDDYHAHFIARLSSAVLGQKAGASLAVFKEIYEEKKANNDKGLTDLVELAAMGSAFGYSEKCLFLEQIVKNYPNSPWRIWAEYNMIRTYRQGLKLRYSEEYLRNLKEFLKKYPDCHLTPHCLYQIGQTHYERSIADINNTEDSQEAIRHFNRILNDYPDLEFYCALARQSLKKITGVSLVYPEGYSEKIDKNIMSFYRLYHLSGARKKSKKIITDHKKFKEKKWSTAPPKR